MSEKSTQVLTSNELIVSKIRKWREDLSDLTKRNSLLKFDPTKKSTLALRLKANEANQIFQELVNNNSFHVNNLRWICDQEKVTKSLKILKRNASSILKEKGVNSLFIVVGTLTWPFKVDSEELVKSPIVLIPVELKFVKGSGFTIFPNGEPAFINPVLAQKLKADYGMSIPEIEENDLARYESVIVEMTEISKSKKTWKVSSNEVFLGQFEPSKAAMIKDLEYLEKNIDTFCKNPVLLGLAGDRTLYAENFPKSQFDAIQLKIEQECYDEEVFQVLDADSSQQEVIESAKQGISFLVQGPPGTGKSQTIVNIITELIAQGKKVLLVADKPGALNVVFDNLNKVGLGDLCLVFRPTQKKVQKKEFAKELSSYLEKTLAQRYSQKAALQRSLALVEGRVQMGNYVQTLHKKHKSFNDKSLFEMYGECLSLKSKNIPEMIFTLPDIQSWSEFKFQKLKKLLEDLSLHHSLLGSNNLTMWEASIYKEATHEQKSEFELFQLNLDSGFSGLDEQSGRLKTLLNRNTPKNLLELNSLCDLLDHLTSSPELLRRWKEGFKKSCKEIEQAKADLEDLVDQLTDMENHIFGRYFEEFRNISLKALSTSLRKRGLCRILDPKCWRLHSLIYNYLRQEYKKPKIISFLLDWKTLRDDLATLDKILLLTTDLNSSDFNLREFFEPFFGLDVIPDFQEIETSIHWLKVLELKSSSLKIKKSLIFDVLESPKYPDLRNLGDNLQQARAKISQGCQYLNKSFPDVNQILPVISVSLDQAEFKEIKKIISRLRVDLREFQRWTDYLEIIKELKELNIGAFLEEIKSSNIDSQYWFYSFFLRYHQLCVDNIHGRDPDLRRFNFQIHEDRRDEYVKLDKQQYTGVSTYIVEENTRRLNESQSESWFKEQFFSLKQESQAKSKKEIRQIIGLAPELISRLKPCWLMSPLAVSENIDSSLALFDTVIFDEASQVRTEASISAILRSKQVIVVGDTNQLPPTSFFSGTSNDDDEDDNENIEYGSFLAACDAFMDSFTLKWHYRSRDESLIAFSNQHIYGGALVTFPSPGKSESRGLHFHYVEDALYSRGSKSKKPVNEKEAQEVAKLAIQHAQRYPEYSLGIITFSQNQADIIDKYIQGLVLQNPDSNDFFQEDSEKYFVKSLESVQGDERDVIILSFGYAKDMKDGTLKNNFGPLGYPESGKRRLNVAITRAKQKLVLVASVRPIDFKSDGGGMPQLLRQYFEMAIVNNQPGLPEVNTKEPLSCVIQDIAHALQFHGYEFHTSIGVSQFPIDLAVVNPANKHEYLLAIQCDGLVYKSLRTVRDRDHIRPSMLEKFQWNIHYVWSVEWFKNREVEVERLIEKLKILSR
jgi:DNA polymerase III delta prime subunit